MIRASTFGLLRHELIGHARRKPRLTLHLKERLALLDELVDVDEVRAVHV